MAVAVTIHSMVLNDPFVNLTGRCSCEQAAACLCIAVVHVVLGSGKLSLDAQNFGERTTVS